MNSVNHSK